MGAQGTTIAGPLVVLGSNNLKKRDELAALVEPRGLCVATLADFPGRAIVVEEDGRTFEHNARKKAAEQALALGEWVLADDSGLCVDALGGEPGVDSALYAGRHGDDDANNSLLLERLAEIPPEKRGAHYVAVLVLADPRGEVRAEARGECFGRIASAPRGEAGFGYDPLFEIRELHLTFGELGPAVKRALSHRARAMRQMLPRLIAELRQG
ncbi:MAG: non-canonical purine NTP pyrophosphatase [Lacipirellulaceae bacterium]